MPWTPEHMPDQAGRAAVITGANQGLGLEIARGLFRRGSVVIMAVRDVTKAESAREAILAERGSGSIEIQHLDLASLSSVKAAATAILDHHPQLDLLINNAGIMASAEARTEDGFERQLGINHLGHFVLTAELLPALAGAPASRIVSVTSTGRHIGRSVDTENPHLDGRYGPWRAYGQSKLANVHFAMELHRRLARAGASTSSLVAHPGLSSTGLQATSVASSGGGQSQRFFHALARMTGMPPDRAAFSLLRAATDPHARGGTLYAPRFVNLGPPVRRPLVGRSVAAGPARRLWTISERETGIRFDVEEIVRNARSGS